MITVVRFMVAVTVAVAVVVAAQGLKWVTPTRPARAPHLTCRAHFVPSWYTSVIRAVNQISLKLEVTNSNSRTESLYTRAICDSGGGGGDGVCVCVYVCVYVCVRVRVRVWCICVGG